MLIEYKIKFEKDGMTITQRVEPGDSRAQLHGPTRLRGITVAKHLGSSFSGQGGGPGDPPGPGGGGLGSGQVTILGPFIIGGYKEDKDRKSVV